MERPYILHVVYVISQELLWRQNFIDALSHSFCHLIQRCAKLNFMAVPYAGSGSRLKRHASLCVLPIDSLGLFRAVRRQYAIARAPSPEPVLTGMILE